MTMVYEIQDRLAAAGFGTPGVDLFTRLTEEPNEQVGVADYPGEAPLDMKTGPVTESPRFQVAVRALSESAAREKAYAIFEHLATFGGGELSGVPYQWIRPLQSPFFLERDGKGRTTYVANYQVQKQLSPTT